MFKIHQWHQAHDTLWGFSNNSSFRDWSIITVRIFFSTNNDRALERRRHMIHLNSILFGAFQFDHWRGKVRRPLSTLQFIFSAIAAYKVKPAKMINKTLSGISYAVFCFPGLNFYVAKANSLRPSRFVLAKPIVWNNRNLAAFSLSSFLSFLNKIKLMGYVYDNIVGGLKVILPIRELLSKFLLELNVKLFSDLILFNQPLTASRGMKISNVVSSCCAEIHSMKFRRIILQLWVQRQGRYALNNIKHFFYKNERLHVIN